MLLWALVDVADLRRPLVVLFPLCVPSAALPCQEPLCCSVRYLSNWRTQGGRYGLLYGARGAHSVQGRFDPARSVPCLARACPLRARRGRYTSTDDFGFCMRVGSRGSAHLCRPPPCAHSLRGCLRVLTRRRLQYYTADRVCPFGMHCFYLHDGEAEESPRRRSRRGSRTDGSGRGRGRFGGGGRGRSLEGGTAGVDPDVLGDELSEYLRDLPPEEDDEYYSMPLALDEILFELLDLSSSRRGLHSGYFD